MTLARTQPASRFIPTRVLVVDAHPLSRRGLRIALSQEPDIEVVGECVDATAAVHLVSQLTPDVVLLDVATPSAGGLAACRAILSVAPAVRVLLLTPGGLELDPAAAAAAGSWGVLVKDASVAELGSAIRTAADAPAAGPARRLTAPQVAALE